MTIHTKIPGTIFLKCREKSLNYSETMISEKTHTNKSTVCQQPVSLISKHYKECVDKRGLDPHWILANCYSITKEKASEKLGYKVYSDGIWLEGSNGVGSFKPDTYKGKCKYLNSKVEYDIIFPTDPNNPDLWEEMEALKEKCIQINNHPCVLATEGVFKAIAGCSAGIPTVALLGVELGLTPKKSDPQGKRYLVSGLEKLVKAGIGIIIGFDADAATKHQVASAQKRLAHQLNKFNIPIYSITGMWDVDDDFENKNKGIDDYIMNHGEDKFHELVSNAETIESWESQFKDKLDKKDITQLEVAEKICEKYRTNLAWNIQNKSWYYYQYKKTGLWSEISREELSRIIILDVKSILGTIQNYSYVENVLKFVRDFLAIADWKDTKGLIPLEDGVLRIKDKKLLPHSPGYKFLWQLPYKWADRSLGCKPITDWLNETMMQDPTLVELLVAYAKAVVCRRYDLHRYIECIGEGGTGKSTYLTLLSWVAGEENTAVTTLKHLENNQFETASFLGKLLVLITDSEKYAGEVATLKAMTGGDLIRCEKKNQQQTKGFVYEGMVAIAANESIRSKDYTSGTARRRLTVLFGNKVDPEKMRDLKEEFKPYLAGFLDLILSMSDERMTQLVKLTDKYVPSLNSFKNQVLIETNDIAEWLDECCVLDSNAKTYVGTLNDGFMEKLYSSFHNFVTSRGKNSTFSTKAFSNNLLSLVESQLKIEGVHRYKDRNGSHFTGISLRSFRNKDKPSPITGLPCKNDTSTTENCRDVMDFNSECDGFVTGESTGSDGCDGCDAFLEKQNYKEENNNSAYPPPIVEGSRRKKPSHPSQVSLPMDTAVTEASPVIEKPVTEPPTLDTHSQQFSITDDPFNDGSTQFNIGDKIQYCGNLPPMKKKFGGILKISKIGSGKIKCIKEDRTETYWISHLNDFKLVNHSNIHQ